ncbi:MAG: hypothetical protein NNA20_10975 [Nitrospira sp.]|nr:hypothetical protein [Nitrospira sp.]MCP9443104.1 hypothetical protein [Nitrospira sp.]
MPWFRATTQCLTPPGFSAPQTFGTTRRSPSWILFQGYRPRWKNRRAGLIGSGTRKGQALIKRLARQERGKTIKMDRRIKLS